MLQGSQQAAGLVAQVIFWSIAAASVTVGATVRSSTNFTVLAPNARLADTVVVRAETFRSRIGAVWLEGSLPATRTPAVLFVEIDENRSFARTLVDAEGDQHIVWLVGSEQEVTRELLAHELVHVVMAQHFGGQMPKWADEGIASRYDNPRRHRLRERELQQFAEQQSWPHLHELFEHSVHQQWQYAAAVSVTDFLVEQGGEQTFMKFVASGATMGWDAALERHYGLPSTAALEHAWQKTVRATMADGASTTQFTSVRAPSSTRYAR